MSLKPLGNETKEQGRRRFLLETNAGINTKS